MGHDGYLGSSLRWSDSRVIYRVAQALVHTSVMIDVHIAILLVYALFLFGVESLQAVYQLLSDVGIGRSGLVGAHIGGIVISQMSIQEYG
jgi:hypothetical protein